MRRWTALASFAALRARTPAPFSSCPSWGFVTPLTATRFRSGSFWQTTCRQRPAGCEGIPACAHTGTPDCGRKEECGEKKKPKIKRGSQAGRFILSQGFYPEYFCHGPLGIYPGTDMWRGDRPLAECGLLVLGTPVGHSEYVRAWATTRAHEERHLLEQLPRLPDLQCAWLLLAMCASPRANHR